MSRILEEMYEKGRVEGIAIGEIKGAVEICFSLGMSASDVVRVIMKKFKFSENMAKYYVNEYQIKAAAD